jgi:hypothetical protein
MHAKMPLTPAYMVSTIITTKRVPSARLMPDAEVRAEVLPDGQILVVGRILDDQALLVGKMQRADEAVAGRDDRTFCG